MTAYEAAIEVHNAAQVIFAAARDKFYAIPGIASKADFAEFAAAQAAMKAANREFDVAYEIEANRVDEVVEIEEESDVQYEMFS